MALYNDLLTISNTNSFILHCLKNTCIYILNWITYNEIFCNEN